MKGEEGHKIGHFLWTVYYGPIILYCILTKLVILTWKPKNFKIVDTNLKSYFYLFFLGLGFLFKFAHKFTSLNCPNITIKLWKQKR